MKKNISRISLEHLNKNQKRTLYQLKVFFKKEAVLSGGTALMLQHCLRKSYDLDIFFPYHIPDSFLRLASDIFDSEIRVTIDNPDELTFIANDEVKVSFIYFPFNRKYKPLQHDAILISSCEEIASDKAYAIGRRPAYRDYVDLFIILKQGFPISQIIIDAKEKFGGEFSAKLFLSQLVYFEDIEDFTIDYISKEYKKEKILDFFQNQVTDYKNSGTLK
jgi:predicted nucleotidyltransferase component of viral defense system